jgi:hypothetical protein
VFAVYFVVDQTMHPKESTSATTTKETAQIVLINTTNQIEFILFYFILFIIIFKN